MKTCDWCAMPSDSARWRAFSNGDCVCDNCYEGPTDEIIKDIRDGIKPVEEAGAKTMNTILEQMKKIYPPEMHGMIDDAVRIAENAQWLRFAEALIAGGRFSGGPERHATEIVLWADAMLAQAKKRGRV